MTKFKIGDEVIYKGRMDRKGTIYKISDGMYWLREPGVPYPHLFKLVTRLDNDIQLYSDFLAQQSGDVSPTPTPTPPKAIIERVYTAPTSAKPLDVVLGYVKIKNVGGQVGDFDIKWINADTGAQIGITSHIPSLSPGNSIGNNVNITMPNIARPLRVLVKVYYKGNLQDSKEVTVTYITPPAPVTPAKGKLLNVVLPTSKIRGSTAKLSATIKNIGGTTRKFQADLYRVAVPAVFVAQTPVYTISPGESVDVSITWNVPMSGTSVRYSLRCVNVDDFSLDDHKNFDVKLTEPLTCTGGSPTHGTGCALLIAADRDHDGKVTSIDAMMMERSGAATHEEAQYILQAAVRGSINALCPGCYTPPRVCNEGEKRNPETCYDGSVIHKEVCRGNKWVSTGEACPTCPKPTLAYNIVSIDGLSVTVDVTTCNPGIGASWANHAPTIQGEDDNAIDNVRVGRYVYTFSKAGVYDLCLIGSNNCGVGASYRKTVTVTSSPSHIPLTITSIDNLPDSPKKGEFVQPHIHIKNQNTSNTPITLKTYVNGTLSISTDITAAGSKTTTHVRGFHMPNSDVVFTAKLYYDGTLESEMSKTISLSTPDPCTGITCPNTCDGTSLYSQKCVDGHCVKDTLIESNSSTCGYVPPADEPHDEPDTGGSDTDEPHDELDTGGSDIDEPHDEPDIGEPDIDEPPVTEDKTMTYIIIAIAAALLAFLFGG